VIQMQKKKKQKLNYEKNYGSDNEVLKIVKILIAVVLFLVVFYFLAMIMTGEIKFGNKKKEEVATKIQYDEILAGETFNKNEEEYYVFYFNFSEKISSNYLTYREEYLKKSEHFPMYMVDLEKGFNTSYIRNNEEEREEYPESIGNLKVTSPTIVKVKDKKVVERMEGKDEVKEFLKNINR